MELTLLSNPPSLYHTLAYCLGAILQVQLLPKRAKGWKLPGMELAFLAAGLLFCAATDVGNARLYVPILLGMLGILFATIYACCRISPRNALYFTLRAFAVGEFTASMEWQLFVYGAGVLMLHAQHMRLIDLDRKLEIEMLRQTMEAQYANYRVHEQSMELVNRKYHDLKHQIAFLRGELTDEQRGASLDRMEAELAAFEAQADTGNRVLDVICSAKLLQCQGAGIEMICDINGALLNFLDPMDLSALFGNALDNAIEGAGALPKEAKPSIRARVYEKRGFILIEIGNSCDGAPSFEDGLPRSTKGDPRYHGFGTKSILETAKKYGGSANFSVRDGWFELKVLLPKP